MPEQNTDPAEISPLSNYRGMIDYYQGKLESDTQELEQLGQQFKTSEAPPQAPQRDTSGIMNRAPFLIAMAALGGKFAKMSGRTMLAATNGMVKGMLQGNEQAYLDNKKRYDEEYQRWLEKNTQQQKLYNEMRQVYKGRIDADVRALEFARKATGDEQKVTMDDWKQWKQMQDYNLKLQDLDAKIDHNQAMEEIGRERAARQSAATSQKRQQAKQDLDQAVSDIDNLKAMIQKNPSATGLAGYGSRALEVARTATGIGSQQAPAHQIQTATQALMVKLPKLLTGSSKSAKDERERVDQIANVLSLGTTDQIAVQKLDELKAILTQHQGEVSDQPDEFGYIVGKPYTDAQGRKAVYQGNGQWQAQAQ